MGKWLSTIALVALVAVSWQTVVASEALKQPDTLTEQAPDAFAVEFETSKGKFVIDVTRSWAPKGADRFYNLVKNHFYDDVRIFRVVPNFVVQFGMSGDPELSELWQNAPIKDDSVIESNATGTITFAMAGPNSRTTQVFINLKDNGRLDEMGFSPFGAISEGMDVVSSLYSGYGDGAPRGRGPNQSQIAMEGNAYLDKSFPELDKIVKATVIRTATDDDAPKQD